MKSAKNPVSHPTKTAKNLVPWKPPTSHWGLLNGPLLSPADPQVFFRDFHPPSPIFFMILAQMHVIYHADRSSAALHVSSSLFFYDFEGK